MRPRFLNPHRRSLLRGSLLVLISLAAALLLSHFPQNRATPALILPVLVAILGIADTARCMQPRWNYYHAGVVLCIYMDLMALTMIAFLLIFPYAHGIPSSR